jgi:hypothetical protein
MRTLSYVSLFSCSALLMILPACAAPTSSADGTADDSSSDAITSASDYYVLSKVNHTTYKGDAYIAPANGGTMKCAAGNTASSCLATFDATGVTGADGAALSADEAAAAKASFLAGNLVAQGTFGKKNGVTTLSVTKAWTSAGTPAAAASSDNLWLVTPNAALFHDRELGSTYARNAATLDLTKLGLAADAEANARKAIANGGVVVRGTHSGSGAALALHADGLYTPVAHAASAAGNDLTAAQQAQALHDIDNLCGDTWCDGDYNFRFDTLTCNFTTGNCTIAIEVTYPNDGADNAPWYPRSCALTGFHAYTDMVTVLTPTFSQVTDALNNEMFDCTQNVEPTIPK